MPSRTVSSTTTPLIGDETVVRGCVLPELSTK